ncbi:MAG: nucleotide sugar dehydrogenase [Magnetococcales bacterium]|nr:nucleotide sugar dehydrogenase [Magnetococcales bacterium]
MELADTLIERIKERRALIGVVGLGYVGLPLAMAFADRGFRVLGFDLDPDKCTALMAGRSYIKHISDQRVGRLLESGLFEATHSLERLDEPDAILICVPTPLNAHREPDLSYVLNTGRAIARRLRRGCLVCLESTTYPGTTDETLLPVLEKGSGLKAGVDFFLAFSPEREDPNNPDYETTTIPKVVGGLTHHCLRVADALYGLVVVRTVPVSSTRVAEASKILENTYRAVNIALVNELKVLFDRMGIDVWEVIHSARTKPFGFHAFYPGPGLGGHCIPIDPFYLTWKAREYDVPTRFIELAGEVNSSMPYFVVEKCREALNARRKSLNGARILLLGVAYKKNIDDYRESPSFKLIRLLSRQGAEVDYHDPHVARCTGMRHYPEINLSSVPLTPEALAERDLVLVATDHDAVDYPMIFQHAKLIVDTRNVFAARELIGDKVVKA